MSIPILEVENLYFTYDKTIIFENINFSINQGEILSILGANGCGKTTLINCILGFLQPQQGSIRINGVNKNKLKISDYAKLVSYVPQSHNKIFPYSVEEIILMGRVAYTPFYSSPNEKEKEIVYEAMEIVGIGAMAKKPYTNLSGGEGQLVMLARAIAQKTPIIIMDEPTSHLDCYNELLVLDRIKTLVKSSNISIIMATHFPNQVFNLINSGIDVKVALMKNKFFFAFGEANDVLTESNISTLYNINACILEKDQGEFCIKQIVPLSITDEKYR